MADKKAPQLAREWNTKYDAVWLEMKHTLSLREDSDCVVLVVNAKLTRRVEWYCSPPGFHERTYDSGIVFVGMDDELAHAVAVAKSLASDAWMRWAGEEDLSSPLYADGTVMRCPFTPSSLVQMRPGGVETGLTWVGTLREVGLWLAVLVATREESQGPMPTPVLVTAAGERLLLHNYRPPPTELVAGVNELLRLLRAHDMQDVDIDRTAVSRKCAAIRDDGCRANRHAALLALQSDLRLADWHPISQDLMQQAALEAS